MTDISVNEEEAPFSAVAIFAETVREERAGMFSLINILPDTILLGAVPATLPTLHAYIRICYDPAKPPHTVSAGLRVGDAAPAMTQRFDPDKLRQAVAEARADHVRIGTIIAHFGATCLQIDGPCALNATVTWDEAEFIIGTLRIKAASAS